MRGVEGGEKRQFSLSDCWTMGSPLRPSIGFLVVVT
jgi:hypothetical protein